MTDASMDLTAPGTRIPRHRHAAWIAEARELLRLAMPLVATQLAQMAILATDTLMLGHLSPAALAAAALSNTMLFLTWMMGCGPANAVSPVIAQALGADADDAAGVRASVRMGLWATLLMVPPLMALLLLTRPILLLIGEDEKLASDAALYMSTLCFVLPPAVLFQVLRSFATAVGRPVAPMIVMVLAVIFNAAGDYALIFGHFGAPRLGIIGAGLASSMSNLFSFAAMAAVIALTPALRRYHIMQAFWTPDWARLRELFRLGIPIGLTTIFEVMLFNSATLMMGLFGTATLAAHQIALTIPSITFMVPLGIGLAATVRVGLAAGADDIVAARRAGFVAMGIATLFMLISSLLLLLFPAAIARLWIPSGNAEVIGLTVTFLTVASIFQVADGLQVTSAMALRGLKDARAPMWIAGASYWLVGFPACLVLGFWFKLAGLGVWIGLAFGLFVAAALLTARFIWLSKER